MPMKKAMVELEETHGIHLSMGSIFGSNRLWSNYERMLEQLSLRLREPYTILQLATLAASLTDGIALRAGLDPERTQHARRPDDEQEWTLLGVGFVAIVNECVEDALAG
ncbi:MAG: hypothetical protein QNJ12_18860 [Ilumatobacter sp.]|uniref:hypothetical protein n=1 Tax=Ilumatobacter sp. TaxID=1967498 RepID=UPI00260CD77C|nr:hypothetical protein [Ilumatobacter sp.]MDJ0770862.1 hypothetical protein [Ilumatobacter sp.]